MNEGINGKELSEQGLQKLFTTSLSTRMAKADWLYEYSDDLRIWSNGVAEIHKITEDLKLLSRMDGALDESKKLWDQHVPPHSVRQPSFFESPQLLDVVLDGAIMKRDIPAVQQILQQQEQGGNRFVSFDVDPLTLPKDRFSGFPSAIEAQYYAYENSTLEKTYITESISSLRKDMKQAVAPDKEKMLKEISERLQEYQQESKRSRGSELSS